MPKISELSAATTIADGDILPFAQVLPDFNITFMGDSKTAARGFQEELLTAVNSVEIPTQLATGGWHVAELEAATDEWIENAEGVPRFVLINIGINDITHGTTQEVFETKLASILNKIHTAWPLTLVYVARVWKAGISKEDPMPMDDVWIPNALAGKELFAAIGIDEREILDESTMEGDGTHPNTAGYHNVAVGWETVLGF